MDPLEEYCKEIAQIRRSGSGVPETSYYPALSNLFNAVGQSLKPKVRCIINIANQGQGIPDGGLFSLEGFSRGEAVEFTADARPSRGVIEVKPSDRDVEAVAASGQVQRYFEGYRQVLVLNLWDFLLVGRGGDGVQALLERFRLAESEAEFWIKAAHPRAMAKEKGQRFLEYLKRVMLRQASLVAPKDLAWMLASYGREALMRVESAELPALSDLKAAMEESLGMRFEGDKGEHFFRSTLVQTLFYGVFSAWVFWARRVPPGDAYSRFDWKTSSFNLHVPMISSLFHEVASPGRLAALGLMEVLDWTGQVLNRVDRAEFFSRFQEEHAVQYFYEPFLEAFDPKLRKDLGVWYTPTEIVRYMVERVDRVLRSELGVADGLADPKVVVLDPCCGTGAYLVEVLERIARTLKDKHGDALSGQDLKRAAMERVFGFEILPAPYVVAHLQLGLALARHGAALRLDPSERAAVFLTNALTGWEPAGQPKHLFLPELEQERDAADRVKQEARILVILGNPPYNAFAGVGPREEGGLVDVYKAGLIENWGVKKFNLDDLYVRFFRLAERRIAEMTGRGVVCFISNFSYLSGTSYVVMRQQLLSHFDGLWFDCLNGDSRETGKLTPEGRPDPSVFSTEYNKEGIRVGTAVGLMVKTGRPVATAEVRFRHFWGAGKREELLAGLEDAASDKAYDAATPGAENRFSFRPMDVGDAYLQWPSLTSLAMVYFAGIAEDRKKCLFDTNRQVLVQRMKKYFDESITIETLKQEGFALSFDMPRFNAEVCRTKLLKSEGFRENRIVKYAVRPFDAQWCYYSPLRPLWREPRQDYWKKFRIGQPAIVTRKSNGKSPEGAPLYCTTYLADYHLMPPNGTVIPYAIDPVNNTANSFQLSLVHNNNLYLNNNISTNAERYLVLLSCENHIASDLLYSHCLSVAYSVEYQTNNADGIRADWPRIPLPATRKRLEHSAALGRRIARLLDTETPVSGVTAGTLPPALALLGLIRATGDRPLNPDAGHLELTAGWGHLTAKGVTMPGQGRVLEREYSHQEREAIGNAALERGLDPDEALARLGETTLDVHLNDAAFWSNIPVNVWKFHIGGYQVIKKWLSYREKGVLGRSLTLDEARHVTDTARRLAAIRLLEPELDVNYRAAIADTYPWPHD